MSGTDADEIKELTKRMTEPTHSYDGAVACVAALTSAALVCVCHDMMDDDIRRLFDLALDSVRVEDGAAQKRGTH